MSVSVDTSGFDKSIQNIKMTEQDLLNIEGAGARIQINGQRNRVAVDTGATRSSVNSHIEESSAMRVVDEIGPETDYAPNIEYGRKDMPNYPIQPFVRPTANEDFQNTIRAIGNELKNIVVSRWQK